MVVFTQPLLYFLIFKEQWASGEHWVLRKWVKKLTATVFPVYSVLCILCRLVSYVWRCCIMKVLEKSLKPPSVNFLRSKVSISDGYIHCEHCQTLPLHVVLCEYMIHCTQSKAMNPISNQELLCVIFYGRQFMRARIHFVSWTWLTNATSKLPFLRVCLSEARSQEPGQGGGRSTE